MADHTSELSRDPIVLPAPTAWPMVLALGLTLVLAGLVTSLVISVLGILLAAAAAAGWFREVLPEERSVSVPIEGEEPRIASARTLAPRAVGPLPHRARLPIEIYPVSSGVKGGVVGSVAMALVALLFGLLFYRSVWYPINLLAAAFDANLAQATTAELAQFNLVGLLTATIIHGVTSILVGLLYGAMLPMLPSHPILFGGLVAPLLWSGLLYGTLEYIDPTLNARVDWLWFVASQITFGITAGVTVSRGTRVRTLQYARFVAPGSHTAGPPRQGGPREGQSS